MNKRNNNMVIWDDIIRIGDTVNIVFHENHILYGVKFLNRIDGIYTFMKKSGVVLEVKNFSYIERAAQEKITQGRR